MSNLAGGTVIINGVIQGGSSLATPVAINKGGTGQTTAAAALLALGGCKTISGSYTGNGNASQSIVISGFPNNTFAVIVYAQDTIATSGFGFSGQTGDATNGWDGNLQSSSATYGTGLILITDSGFAVSNGGDFNITECVYTFIAFGN